jgi:transcriptional regulator with XRE-family HTH domain
MSTNHQIGFKIKQLREKKKMSQAELAEQLNVSQARLSSIENGDTEKIDYVIIDKICQIFDVKHEYFREDNQINNYNIKVNKGNVSTNHYGNVYQCPDELIESIKQLIADYQKGK